MLNLDSHTAVRQGILELFAGVGFDYFTMGTEVQDIVDGIYGIMECMQLRSDTIDSEAADALTRVIETKVQRMRALIKEVVQDW